MTLLIFSENLCFGKAVNKQKKGCFNKYQMKTVFKIALVFVLFANLPVVFAVDLLSLYKEAKMHDATLAAAKAEHIAAQEILPQSKAVLEPEAQFQADSTWNRIDFQAKVGSSFINDYGDHRAGITVTQPLYRPQLSIAVEQARVRTRVAEITLQAAEQDLMLRVVNRYFYFLRKGANLSAVKSEKVAVFEQLEQAKRNFLVGTATVTDQREAQARYDLVLAHELEAENELEVARSQLSVLLGRELTENLDSVTLPIDLPRPVPDQADIWIEQAYKSSFDVVIAQHNLGIAQQEVRRHNAENQPTVDAIGSHSFADQGFSSFGKYSAQSTSVGIRFKLPLYKGGGISSRVREAVALQERSRQDLELARRNSAQKTTESFLGVTSGLARVRALEQAVASTQLQLESTKLGQEVGVRTAVDVLNAEQQLTGARRNLYDAVYATIVAQLGLKAAVGRLSESDLESVNRLLN